MAERGRLYLILADEDLISLVEAADAEAFATLYDRHSRAAFSLAYRMMGERQASEDLAQDAFLTVWRGATLAGERSLCGDVEDRAARPGQGGPQHPPARAAEDTGAGVLFRLHGRGDIRPSRPASRNGQGQDAFGSEKDQGLLQVKRRGGAEMSEMNNERFEDLKDAYVLGALPEEERLSFEDYLAAHPERQAEVDELGAVAGLLAFSAPEQEPSPELRSRVMEMIEAEPRRVGGHSTFARVGDFLSVRSLALGAAALLVIGLLSWNLALEGQVEDLQGQVEDAQSQVQNLQGQVADGQAQQTRTIELKGAWAEQGATAEVASMQKNEIILVARNMPSVPEGRTCQIWVISDDVPKPSGLFQPDGNGTATPITNSITKADVIAVTVEPAGGSEQPTSDPVLLAEL